MTALSEKEREGGGGRESREGKEMGSNRIVKETSLRRERGDRHRQKRADRHSQQRKQIESQDRQMERQGQTHTAAEKTPDSPGFCHTSCVTQF